MGGMATSYSIRPVVFMTRDGAKGKHLERSYYAPFVHDAPERGPSEKLVEDGPATLSVAELFAAVFASGADSAEDVLALSSRIVKEYGEQAVMSATDAKKLADDLSIALPQAVQTVAVAELNRRFPRKNELAMPVIRSAGDVFAYAAGMRDLPKEHLRGIYLNPHYKVIHDEVISIGTVDTSIIHPREVFKPALEHSAAAVILVHNHPSGETAPSEADLVITKQLVEAAQLLGIDLIDHVIVTRGGYESIAVDYSR